jgi:hypothetical protein
MHACFLTASEQYYENFRNKDHRALDRAISPQANICKKPFRRDK